jgi:ADP-ribose pyrophosphatase YjhB (NUDIX family)
MSLLLTGSTGMSTTSANYCQLCAGRLQIQVPENDLRKRLVCGKCGNIVYAGPKVLVLTHIFAQDHVMLVKRGIPPYQGRWAPCGGFVEAGESLESAATREIYEEVGLSLAPEQMMPLAHMSLPVLNQIYAVFFAVIDDVLPLRAALPEIEEARWFLESAYPKDEIWEPSMGFDIGRIFDRVRSGRFDFYQRTDDTLRVISTNSDIQYLWKKR